MKRVKFWKFFIFSNSPLFHRQKETGDFFWENPYHVSKLAWKLD